MSELHPRPGQGGPDAIGGAGGSDPASPPFPSEAEAARHEIAELRERVADLESAGAQIAHVAEILRRERDAAVALLIRVADEDIAHYRTCPLLRASASEAAACDCGVWTLERDIEVATRASGQKIPPPGGAS